MEEIRVVILRSCEGCSRSWLQFMDGEPNSHTPMNCPWQDYASHPKLSTVTVTEMSFRIQVIK